MSKTLAEIIDFVDGINPNKLDDNTKAAWISEAEGIVQTDVMLIAPADIVSYVYSYTWAGTGVTFPAANKMVFPTVTKLRSGDLIAITGLSDYSGNNISTTVSAVSADGKTLTFPDDTFADTGETGETETATVAYDGSGTKVLVAPPYDKLYWTYLTAMVDFARGEYGRYQNSMQMFNSFMGEFARWYARTYNPASGRAITAGYYISAYGAAVNHGFAGTEEQWLKSLTGPQGNGFRVLGFYATLDALTAAVTAPAVGDGYGVGSAEPYIFYIWDGAAWVDNGTLSPALAESWARGGTGIRAGEDTDNAKYYAELSAAGKTAAEAAAAGAAGSRGAAETAVTNAETAETNAETAQAAAESARDAALLAKTAAETAKTNAETAEGNAEAAQGAAEEAETGAQAAQGLAETARDAAALSKTGAETAKVNAETAKTGADTAKAAAETAKGLAETAKGGADSSAVLSESYAVGGTGTRAGEDTDNAKYYKEQAASIVGGDYATKTEAQGYASAAQAAAEAASIPILQKGTASGVAELDASGKVPSSQLPSYVDDVLEYVDIYTFPITGEGGKIYVDLNTLLAYRWSGSTYVEISPSIALGETSTTAYRGDRGKTAYDHSQATGNPHGATPADVGAAAAVHSHSGYVQGLTFTGTSVFTTAFVADATFTNWGYRATVALAGVTADMTPSVVFAPDDATGGVLAPVAACYAGGVYLYANAVPGANLTIPTITCTKEVA